MRQYTYAIDVRDHVSNTHATCERPVVRIEAKHTHTDVIPKSCCIGKGDTNMLACTLEVDLAHARARARADA
jgi:hypothetical protein